MLQSKNSIGIIEGNLGDRLRKLIRSSRTAAVITHRNADPDAIASAFMMAYALDAFGLKTLIIMPEGPSRLSKRIIDELGLDGGIISDERTLDDLEPLDVIVTVDSANPAQLRPYTRVFESARHKIVVDHHEGNTLTDKASISLVYRGIPSTTEIVVGILELLEVSLDDARATLGLAGILYDTKRFINAKASTFKAVLKLMEWGGSYHDALRLLTLPAEREDLSERMAKLKALSRLTLGRACSDILIAVTHIGSHESAVARALIDLGADVAVVATSRDSEKRISIRVSKLALERGVTASLIAEYIARKYNGEGGGHDTAAMTHLKHEGSIEDLVESIARSLPGKTARICLSTRRG